MVEKLIKRNVKMSEFLNDPLYHQHTTVERTTTFEHIANVSGIVVDAVVVAFAGLADVAKRVTHHQAH